MTQQFFFLENINMGSKNVEFYADFKFVDAAPFRNAPNKS